MAKKENILLVEYDGVMIPADRLANMAKKAGIYNVEHYVNSFLLQIIMGNSPELMVYVNDIREYYHLELYPMPGRNPASKNNMPNKDKEWDEVRRIYKDMTDAEREACLKECLELLMANDRLFTNKSCWMGLYLVIRDRLDGRLKSVDFYDFALKITPDGWKPGKMIGESTMSNLSRHIDYDDRECAYYDMENNPWEELCLCFADIVLQVILANKNVK